MDLEAYKNIDSDSFQKALQIAAILEGGQIANQRQVVLKESIDEYESYAQINLSLKSVQSIKTANKPLLKFFSPIRPLHTITQHDIEKFITQLKKNAPKGYKVYVRTLRAMFNKFKEWNYITNNPLTKVKFAKTQSVAPKYLTNDEFEKIMQAIENKLIEDFCRVAFDTGMRLSEIVYLRWLNVDLKKRLIVVGDELFMTKTRKQRTVPMSEMVFKVLERRDKEKRRNEYVFGKSVTKPYTGDYFSKKFKEACRAADVDAGIHMHSLRHSAATRMAQSGAPIIAVKEILGHSSINTTMIYAHTDLEAMRAAVNLLK
jgi:integrase